MDSESFAIYFIDGTSESFRGKMPTLELLKKNNYVISCYDFSGTRVIINFNNVRFMKG